MARKRLNSLRFLGSLYVPICVCAEGESARFAEAIC